MVLAQRVLVLAVAAISLSATHSAGLPVLGLDRTVEVGIQHRHLSTAIVGAAGDPPCPVIPPTSPLPGTIPDKIAAAIELFETVTQGTTNGSNVVGMSAVLSYRGQVLSAPVSGFANRSAGTKVSPATTFRIGSVTKVFTALLANILASQGLLSLDDPVQIIAPQLHPINPFDSANITWRQLLEQRSGLQREPPAGLNQTDSVLRAVSETLLVTRPGGRPSYSNLGFAVIGNVLAESVAGKSFSEAVEDLIVKPLGLSSTGVTYDPSVLATLAVGYGPQGTAYPFADLGWGAPAGSMYSTPSDLASLSWAILQAVSGVGPLASSLDPDTAQELTDPAYWNPGGLTVFGAPWEMRAHGTYLVRRKGGNLPGYSTLMSFVPELDLTVAAAWSFPSSEFDNSVAIWEGIVDLFASGLQEIAPNPINPGPNPGDYVGTYEDQNQGLALNVLLNATGQGGLLFQVPGLLGVFINEASSWTGIKDLFQIYLPPNILPCLEEELLAFGGQFVQFGRNAEGTVVNATAFGIIPTAIFSR